jgi:hypothetical protein
MNHRDPHHLVVPPDRFCVTTPDGGCVSTDPRCVHNLPPEGYDLPIVCALQRESGEVTENDQNELAKFIAALRAKANGKTTKEAFDLVYGDEPKEPVGDA